MFDIGASELLVIVVVAVVVIGPKDLPLAMRTAGRWIGKLRRVSGHFRAGVDAMVREAEMEDMEAEWKRRNAEIMARGSGAEPGAVGAAAQGGAGSLNLSEGHDDAEPAVQMEPRNPPARLDDRVHKPGDTAEDSASLPAPAISAGPDEPHGASRVNGR
ncbi:Sec-independent protein translocase protein TatB [Croceicoccus sp. F390]|uniref:Sec-independent protein translocase protein TatB n=1 Tax=Croceicoccus esteveae TaxID=3075597 RepID=A0ABU2ZGG7_9SPHN|nr:Sec-independent protein translocase protein TatB [Croceicoccus sp. F390]MDT0575680.1 Sec-independent protein translocase protein TatB [Croceicoccus sp. F390]